MRQELNEFVMLVDRNRPIGSSVSLIKELESIKVFRFNALKDELCLGGVYIRYERSDFNIYLDLYLCFSFSLL